MTDTVPSAFTDLDVAELRRLAVEDFAVDIKATDNKKTVLAALLESGVEWEAYATLKGLNVEVEPEAAPEVETADAEVIDVTSVEEPVVIIKTAEPIARDEVTKYLIKMERENLRFDIRGHRFTADHPYALVSADDADYILTKEKGFRMAMPRELEEFYG